jgi:mannose-6-phosphate isomerase
MTPLPLPPNIVPRIYRGGTAMGRFRGTTFARDAGEDWVGSTTLTSERRGDLGLSRLADGTLLRDAIEADPLGWLGPEHVAASGASLEVLVKLLNPDQRLPVHLHPTVPVAREHLGCAHGKTESWLVVEAPEDGCVYLGFSADVDAATLAGWVTEQGPMIEALNRLPVRAGDCVLVPAGVPHAIGPGSLIVELQEPTDYSVLLEWKGFDVANPSGWHVGLGTEVALALVDRTAWSAERLATIWQSEPVPLGPGRGSMLPALADPFFRAEEIVDGAVLDGSVSILVVVEGSLSLSGLEVSKGETWVLPYACGPVQVTGSGRAIRCLPPGSLGL